MTIDEAIQRLVNVRKYNKLSINECIALGMAIASLEAWQKVQQDIKELADYDTVDVLVDVNRIINKHLQQIGDDPKMLMLIQNEDGVFEEYDDIYDITIHCHNKYEHDVILAWMNKLNKPDHESDDGK